MKLRAGLKYNAFGFTALAFLVTVTTACGKSGGTGAATPSRPTNTSTSPQPVPTQGQQQYPDQQYPDQYSDTGANEPDWQQPPQTRPAQHDESTNQWNQDATHDESNFDVHIALKDLGVWISIGSDRYFKPTFARADEGRDWQPYQHGYWTFDADLGWTWFSYDQWGSVTEHYGIWRHHKQHGWIWLEFSDHRYRPHAVSWFDDGDYVGWYPYASDYSEGYQRGYADGFDDGYWDGYRTASQANSRGFAFNLGFTLVHRGDVTAANIYSSRVRDPRTVNYYAARGCSDERVRSNRVGFFPGGSREFAFEFIRGSARLEAVVGRSAVQDIGDGQRIVRPPRGHEVPHEERARWHISLNLNAAVLDFTFVGGRIQTQRHDSDRAAAPAPAPAPEIKPAVLDPAPAVEPTPVPAAEVRDQTPPQIPMIRPKARPANLGVAPKVDVAPAVEAAPAPAPVPVTNGDAVVPVSADTIGAAVATPAKTRVIRPRPRPQRLNNP